MDEQSVFRKVALDRLASPERLDQLIHVTSPRAWLALAAFALLVLVMVGWGLLGRISTRVEGQGILLGGDVYNVVPAWSGRVAALHAKVGQHVAAGALVAELEQPELRQQIANAEARLRELQEEDRYIHVEGARELKTRNEYYVARRKNLERSITEREELLTLATAQFEAQHHLVAESLATQEQLIPVQQSLATARADLASTQAELTQATLDRLSANFTVRHRFIASEQAVHDAERELERLKHDHTLQSSIYTTYGGRVLEITADEGSVLSAGQPLMRIAPDEGTSGQMRAVLYVNANDGKRVEAGMPVLVAPATVKPEEHGYIVGHVERIAEFPATSQGMQRVLKNDQLVLQLTAAGPPFEVAVALTRDREAPSGYRWTSGRGPEVAVMEGTPVRGRVIVETRRPVELVIPGLKRILSLY